MNNVVALPRKYPTQTPAELRSEFAHELAGEIRHQLAHFDITAILTGTSGPTLQLSLNHLLYTVTIGFPSLFFLLVLGMAGGFAIPVELFLGASFLLAVCFYALLGIAALVDTVVCYRACQIVCSRCTPLMTSIKDTTVQLWVDYDRENDNKEWAKWKAKKAA